MLRTLLLAAASCLTAAFAQVIEGRIVGWPQGVAGEVVARAVNRDTGLRESLARAPVSTGGGFRLELPEGDVLGPYLEPVEFPALRSEDCDGSITVEPADLTWLVVNPVAEFRDDAYDLQRGTALPAEVYERIEAGEAEPEDLAVVTEYVYLPVSGRVEGWIDCGERMTYAIEGEPGWHPLVGRIADPAAGSTERSIRPIQSDTVWYMPMYEFEKQDEE